ncbi:hypothetical protein LTR09_002961 [Extremus antarcticus]|uniref:Uncharacterized protein n=1 Tax=Extremus antarcticus TaxID=702011 RepID=A0AAJ0GFH7_9PEZI|nr:hypothetical protein LTR09_002961 [Extremus antarcticus]
MEERAASDPSANGRASTRCFGTAELFEMIMLHLCTLCECSDLRPHFWHAQEHLKPGAEPFRILRVISRWRATSLQIPSIRRRLFLDPAQAETLLVWRVWKNLPCLQPYLSRAKKLVPGDVIATPHRNLAGHSIAAPQSHLQGSTPHPVLAGTTYGSGHKTQIVFRLTGDTRLLKLDPCRRLSEVQKQMLVMQPACKQLRVQLRVDSGTGRFPASYGESRIVANEHGVRLGSLFAEIWSMLEKWKAGIAMHKGGKRFDPQGYRNRVEVVISADGFVSSEMRCVRKGDARRHGWIEG